MDIENESERPNSSSSSSASSSTNNSSSNLLINLPMPPSMMHMQDNMDADNNGVHEDDMNDDIHHRDAAAANIAAPPRPQNPPSPSQSPSPSQPPQLQQQQPQPPTTLASSNNQIAADIGNNSVFVSPFLYNNNSTSDTTTSTTPSSSSTTTTPPHQEHFPLSSSHQQPPQHHALSSLSSSSSSHSNTSEAAIVPIIQQNERHPADQRDNIADTIDVSVIPPPSSAIEGTSSSIDEDDDGDVVITGEQRRQQSSISPPTLSSVLAAEQAEYAERQTSPPSSTLPPPTSAPSLPSTLHDSEREQKQTQSSYLSYFTYPSGCGGNSTNLYSNNNRQFGFGNGSGTIGATISMFSNNDNNSVAAGGRSSFGDDTGCSHSNQAVDRIKMLYPNVNENETPLPRCFSLNDKCYAIALTRNDLRVHYKSANKQTDAASIRSAYPIPAACGLYYFEVKIISKGKNGYMGIGLTTLQFRLNRLPGWDKHSYGYHGDDGNSFSSSGSGQSYGPTFTTGDIVGCCLNMVNNTCFYTKNGVDLGIAFKDLPPGLYPTVGLQTPGEEVDANFGQEPFKFDQFEDMLKQMRGETTSSIYNFPLSAEQKDPTALLHKMVSSFLVHNGYSKTAEAFARTTSQTFPEDLTSIRKRQKILKLVMSGRVGLAIEQTLRVYPGLLENNKNLLFMLKCRQFVEMVNGSDVECCPTTNKSPISNTNQTTQTMPPNQTSVIQSTKTYQNSKINNSENSTSMGLSSDSNAAVINPDNHQHIVNSSDFFTANSGSNSKSNEILPANLDYVNDVEMENNALNSSNGESYQNGNSSNHLNSSLDLDEEMDVDVPSTRKYSHGIERILEFGRELSQMGQALEKENKMQEEDRQMLEDAFSLIAYSNPWSSPVGWQLCPTKREMVSMALNSAILESLNYPRHSPLHVCIGHANELLRMMGNASFGSCGFVKVADAFQQN